MNKTTEPVVESSTVAEAVELKRCPFCGNGAVTFTPDADRNIVSCKLGHAPMRSIEAWNTRTPTPVERQSVDGAREIAERLTRNAPRLPCGFMETIPQVDFPALTNQIESALLNEREHVAGLVRAAREGLHVLEHGSLSGYHSNKVLDALRAALVPFDKDANDANPS